jgi:hypothetical protein
MKGGRVAVIALPHLRDALSEDAWLANIEAEFDQRAEDPYAEGYWEELRWRGRF